MAKATEEQKQLWRFKVKDYEESGLSQKRWCDKYNIPISTLGYWSRKIRKEDSSVNQSRWLKVSSDCLSPDLPSSDGEFMPQISPILTLKKDNLAIDLPLGCSSQQIFELLKVLKAL
ncbi:IS66 family insertion sequence element accessory protein TnpA [Aminipila luticellarii]|uniref:Transposase n=1 Tax=Aminipila luticellarii TaxID=2507160 RepID=A0A410PUY1_9FIRM|nr:hypothetical protein [Aminipila luticellarii]QAT42757.1 hypothetical protein EQM06_05665 [Aminipila luticellarii]